MVVSWIEGETDLTREQLLDRVWGGAQYIDPGTVTVHVRRLREKLPVLVDALVTVKQFGYKLMADEVEAET